MRSYDENDSTVSTSGGIRWEFRCWRAEQYGQLGGNFNAEEQSDMVLAILAPSSQPFKLNLSMSKKDYTLTELIISSRL